MTNVEFMREQSVLAYNRFRESVEGLTQEQAWGILPPAADDYLHTDGSVQGIVLHVATAKMMYASAAFRELEFNWRALASHCDEFEPDWAGALAYLERSQAYWLSAWEQLSDDQLMDEVRHFTGQFWPAWKIIEMVNYHDCYHCGQIAVVRYAAKQSNAPPPSQAEDIRKYCSDLWSW